MNDKMGKWEPCPRCGSNKVKTVRRYLATMGSAFLFIGIWLYIFFLGALVGKTFIFLGLFLILIGLLKKNFLMCEDCNYKWEYPAENNKYRDKEN